jgi:hypothetical protein
MLVLHRATLLDLMQRIPELRPTLMAEAEKRSRSLIEPA